MDGWKVERQSQSMSHSTVRVLEMHNRLSANNHVQEKLSMMDKHDNWSNTSASDLRKKLESMSMSFGEDAGGGHLSTNIGGAFAQNGNAERTFSSSIRSMQTEKTVFASSRFTSMSNSGQGQMGSFLPSSISWNVQGNTSMETRAAIMKSSEFTTSLSGLTRSMSSGFPSILSSNSSLDEVNSMSYKTGGANNSEIPSVLSFVSPFRRNRGPFGFRNFDGPLLADVGVRDAHNRMTWDPSILLNSTIKNGSLMHISASQKTVFEASSTSHGAINYNQVISRQSYGASESESEEDDNSDFDEDVLAIKYRKQTPQLTFPSRLAITDGRREPSEIEIDDSSSITTCDLETSSRQGSLKDNQKIPDAKDPNVTPEHRRFQERQRAAMELLKTEQTYVENLYLLDQIFHFRVDQENRAQIMFPPDIITQMFRNIKSLYQLHHDHLLPKLEKRLANWENDPRIGDIMKEFAPFLKMYSEYVQNFDNSVNLISIYREKNPRFAKIIEDIQKMKECRNLPLPDQMICPVQRLGRYRLLLEAYLRRLPEDCNDRADTQDALNIVSKAATHANEAIQRIVHFKKLYEVQENIKGLEGLISPTRVLLKEGKVVKISSRTILEQERYLYLFNDIVLLCSARHMANRMISSAPYHLRAKLDVSELMVYQGDDIEKSNSFYIADNSKRIEIFTKTEKEMDDWIKALMDAKTDLLKRKSSLRLGSTSPAEEELGQKEPNMIQSDSVGKCMECNMSFSMLKRKHHCHACGSVVCAKCSEGKMPLAYSVGRLCRVCNSCKSVLQKMQALQKANSESASLVELQETIRLGILDIPASVTAVYCGSLQLKLRDKKGWATRWFALRSDFVLYCYGSEMDERAMTATPIPGMSVLMVEHLPKSEICQVPSGEKDRAFRISHDHGRKSFFFVAPVRETALDWVHYLQMAEQADFSNGKTVNE